MTWFYLGKEVVIFVIVLIRDCCFSQSSLDTASSIDKSVPLEMPNQRSAIAQAQGFYCIFIPISLLTLSLIRSRHEFSALFAIHFTYFRFENLKLNQSIFPC